MEESVKKCRNCAVSLDKDPNKGGTNEDGSISDKYCSFCYQNGEFTKGGIALIKKMESLVQNAVTVMGMTEIQAKEVADNYCATFVRWK